MAFAASVDYGLKIKESEKKNKYLDLARELKKVMEHEGNVDTNFNWYARNDPQRLDKGIRVRNRRTNRNHQNYSIFEIGRNIEKSPCNLRRLAVT